MVSSDSKQDEGRNLCYARRNQGLLSLLISPSYRVMFSPIPEARHLGQASTQVIHTQEQSRYGLEDCEPDLNLGLNTQTSAQIANRDHIGSKQQGKQPLEIPKAQPNQSVVSEACIQSLLAQITSQGKGGVPPACPYEQHTKEGINLNNAPVQQLEHTTSRSSRPQAEQF